MRERTRFIMSEFARQNPVTPQDIAHYSVGFESEHLLASILEKTRNQETQLNDSDVDRRVRHVARLVRTHQRAVVVGGVVAVAVALAFAFVLPESASPPKRDVSHVLKRTSPASALLLSLAKVAAHSAVTPLPGAGQYLYWETKSMTYSSTAFDSAGEPQSNVPTADKQQYYYTSGTTSQVWVNPAGIGREDDAPNQDGVWLTPGGQTLWAQKQAMARAAGECNPTFDSCDSPTPDHSFNDPDRPYATGPSFPFVYPNNVKLNLPSDPKGLELALQAAYATLMQGAGVSGPVSLTAQQLFSITQEGFLEGLSPAIRSAYFQMLAQIPGVVPLGSVTDDLGQTGVAIGTTNTGRVSGADKQQVQLIFDPTTSALLEYRIVQALPTTTTSGSPNTSGNTGTTGNSGVSSNSTVTGNSGDTGTSGETGNSGTMSKSASASNPPVGSVLVDTLFLSSGVVDSTTVTPQGTTVPTGGVVGSTPETGNSGTSPTP